MEDRIKKQGEYLSSDQLLDIIFEHPIDGYNKFMVFTEKLLNVNIGPYDDNHCGYFVKPK